MRLIEKKKKRKKEHKLKIKNNVANLGERNKTSIWEIMKKIILGVFGVCFLITIFNF